MVFNESLVINQEGLFSIILGVLVLLLVLVGGVYYLGTVRNQSKTLNMVASPSPTIVINTPKEYKTRYFDVNENFWEKDKYPAEITEIAESSLKTMSCSPQYYSNQDTYSYYDEKTQENVLLTDESLKYIIQIINDKHGKDRLSEIFTCSVKEGKPIVVYSLGPCGGGCSGVPYIGVVNDSEISEVVKISETDESPAYFGCRQPLALTKTNMFYFICGGGDGPSASASIYKLSLNNFVLSRVKHCTAGIDATLKSYSKCE